MNLTLYAPCIILQYVYKPTRWTKFLWLDSAAYSDSKHRYAVKKSNKVSYKILLLSDSTFFKLFFHTFAAIIEALIVAGHKFL